jgi:hypothetical protein
VTISDTSVCCFSAIDINKEKFSLSHTQVFERYRRYEPQVAQGLTELRKVPV